MLFIELLFSRLFLSVCFSRSNFVFFQAHYALSCTFWLFHTRGRCLKIGYNSFFLNTNTWTKQAQIGNYKYTFLKGSYHLFDFLFYLDYYFFISLYEWIEYRLKLSLMTLYRPLAIAILMILIIDKTKVYEMHPKGLQKSSKREF